MNFSEKIEEIQGKVKSYNSEIKGMKNIPSEKMIRVMMAEGEILEPCMIIGESDESLDFMFYKKEGPTFSLCIKKEHICGLSILHKPVEDEESAADNVEVSGALYQ